MNTKLVVACVILGLLFAVIPHILWLLGLGVGKIFRYHLPYAPFGWAALALMLVVWGAEAYGYWVGKYKVEVTHVRYDGARVPEAFKGYKVVQLSDIHLGTFLNNPEALQRVVDCVNDQKPDLICFTGDLINLSLAEFDSLSHILARLEAADGVMSVLGNHDLFIYGRKFATDKSRCEAREQLAARERSIGWRLLRNEHVVLHRGTDSLTVVGVDNTHGEGQGFATANLGDLPKALKGVGEEDFALLLSHDPSHWEAEVLGMKNIALTLSGHTHAAQVRIMGWSPASWMFHHVQGRYDVGGQTLYVNRGIGCTLPMRIACPSEITVITL